MTKSPDLFILEKDSDALWTRVTEYDSIMLCYCVTALGNFWVVELCTLENPEPQNFFVNAQIDNPN
ncbi:hypothetical protein, partial [Streptococcus pseudopneumoniae]|uniref:hypothetical protein n=1 Tax=Streptococcus pseudopneumoniae TaxID=257758 RepID=UPI0019D5F7F8